MKPLYLLFLFIPIYSYALGGIKLKVHPEDFEKVKFILDELNSNLSIV